MKQGPKKADAIKWYEKTFGGKNPDEVYKRLSGEVDAYLTESRLFMTPQERLQEPFWKRYSDIDIINPQDFLLEWDNPQ